jgi:hypothetical protein
MSGLERSEHIQIFCRLEENIYKEMKVNSIIIYSISS